MSESYFMGIFYHLFYMGIFQLYKTVKNYNRLSFEKYLHNEQILVNSLKIALCQKNCHSSYTLKNRFEPLLLLDNFNLTNRFRDPRRS